MRKLILIILFFCPILSKGQETDLKKSFIRNNLYTQLDLPFGMISFDYERIIYYSKNFNPVSISLGVSHTMPNYNSLGFNWYGFPIWLTSLYGHNKSHFEIGLGYYWKRSYNKDEIYKYDRRIENTFLVKTGYRFQKIKNGGLNYKIGLEFGFNKTWYDDYMDIESVKGLFLSIGYSF